MKVREILDKAVIGSIINDKRVLSALKRKGLIYDYSYWGYLETRDVFFKDTWNGQPCREHYMIYLFPKGNAHEAMDAVHESREAMYSFIGNTSEISYLGCKFRTKYLDGCFNAYLQLVERDGNREAKANPRMSAWGAIH